MKKCKDCQIEKPIDDFFKNKNFKSGYTAKCKECFQKVYYWQKKNKILEYQKNYYKDNVIKIRNRIKSYRKKNRNIINRKVLEYRNNNLEVKILHRLRNRIQKAIKNNIKSQSTIELLGCSIEEFKKYLELGFINGISWENYGSYWHIDHIIPCVFFDLSKKEDQKKCFHYTNMRPLEAYKNLSKNDLLPNGNRARYLK